MRIVVNARFRNTLTLDGNMGEKMFNLTWNNHLANLSGLFETLYKSGSLTDVTLACQGGMLRAHRLVLAACSPYFERVFKEHYGDQPILILKGTRSLRKPLTSFRREQILDEDSDN